MLQKFFISRKAYDHDIKIFRGMVADLNKQLREVEAEKAAAKKEAKDKSNAMEALRNEIVGLRQRSQEVKVSGRDLIDYMNPVPEGAQERREYMAQVAMLFHGGLKDKLNYMLTQFKNQTGMFPLSERETDFFRSCINVVGLLLDWGEESVNEHNANIAQANNLAEADAFKEDEQDITRTVS